MNKDIAPVLDEISAVLQKHDMTGIVIVGNQKHCDYRMEIEASWSCARFEKQMDGTVGLRVRCKRAEYASTKAMNIALNSTVGNFVTFSDTIDRVNDTLKSVLVMLSRHIEFIGKSITEE